MSIDYDQFWILGVVRIRASKPDPYAGLRGHDYIKARGLGATPIQRLDAFDKTAIVKRLDTEQQAAKAIDVAANLMTNWGLAQPVKPRRFFVVPTPKKGMAR